MYHGEDQSGDVCCFPGNLYLVSALGRAMEAVMCAAQPPALLAFGVDSDLWVESSA